ncbi:acyl-CoA dehydratase activase [Ruminococcus champanellensis]|uniref:acyl-CoA dehydratase activase n=1 Tax=Ruminococcus champanellensis TaxID=1161942 RepID=UPI0023F291D5|nr:acyl-CoA dehydratase activase [Ruminococcus champanellensis]
MQTQYSLGIDVGSTTVKTVVIDDAKQIIRSRYQRHYSRIKETVSEQLEQIAGEYPDSLFTLCITGSAGLGLANHADLPFVQEVHAAFIAVKEAYPDTDVVIELGGEDAKIIFLTGGVEQRMNGSCAGGTGAFIDQMATLLGVTADELDRLALQAEQVYPIASRCGVFAKSDIQPLLNQGARREDISASIFQAVVDQTVSGLAQGRQIQGKVLFLGGPLSFQKGLRKAFVQTLGLDDAHAVFPETAPVFVAYGCALFAKEGGTPMRLSDCLEKLQKARGGEQRMTGRRLFEDRAEYEAFIQRHKQHDLKYADLHTYTGDAYLGVDAGSTTTKLVLITGKGELLYSHYASNQGQPLDKIAEKLREIYREKNPAMRIRASAVTGYGEELMKDGLGMDFGIVETVAHYRAASYFCPDVDFIIDIGGQDIKCFKIKNHTIDSIMLNEACSSGCGSFIQSFAQAMGYDIAEFSQLGLFARNPVDLGSRCTVFMNSSVKQAQKDGATVEDISAGLSASIIKNAIYKVIRAKSVEELGQNIVVQGGTFLNDAVLRSFEQELGRNVIRPAISGLMGAFGAALYAMEHQKAESTLISPEALAQFSYTTRAATCKGCTAHCSLSIVRFSDGHTYISGNRCEKGAGKAKGTSLPSMMTIKYDRILHTNDPKPAHPKARVGLPMALSFYEQMPFWHAFFNALGFETVRSEESDRNVYYKGQHTIASDTICYPAKLTHGHIESLLEQKVDFIFYPCMSYNIDEGENDNHYNCPVVAYYPELLKANNPKLNKQNFRFPYMDLNQPKNVARVMQETLADYGITRKQTKAATEAAFAAQKQYREWVIAEGQRVIAQARAAGKPIIVLAGRPYHIDPEINHGIHKLITSLDMAVVTEDCVAHLGHVQDLQILNQWTYHARLYRAAEYVTTQPDMQLVQLVSFGCGIDAITTDEVRSILERKGKFYTQLKIDEINNLGAAKIRLRSLVAAMEQT